MRSTTKKLLWSCCRTTINKGDRSCPTCTSILLPADASSQPKTSRDNPAKNHKGGNGQRAATFESQLTSDINNNTGWGVKVKDLFAAREAAAGGSKQLVSAETRGGCGYHYDLVLKFSDESTEKCEVKQHTNMSGKKKMDTMKTPWEYSGQYLNGTGDASWRIRRWYASQWYDKMLPWSKKTFDIKSDIPNFDDWFSNDMSVGDAKTEFGRELKEKIKSRGKKEGSDVMNQKKKEFVNELHVPDEVKKQLYEDYNRETEKVLGEKDCWLSFNSVDCRLWSNIKNDAFDINDLKRREDSSDLVWSYVNKSDNVTRVIRVRFQNRIGVANLSVQCS